MTVVENIVSPASVAIVGASSREGSVGNAVITNILSGGFTGKLYPVNPSSSDTILGLKCYKNIHDCSADSVLQRR